jgi:protocatechuate 3,4-dioxygenase beta subunit
MIRCLLLLAIAAHAQTVQGVAVNSATHKPVAGATVQLIGIAEEADADIYRTQTDAAGRFRFDHVVPGHYRAVADAQGFTRMAYGSNIVGRAQRINVDAASRLQEIVIAMTPASVISGRVADQDGDPIPYVSVDALQYGYQSGKKTLKIVNNVRTDDRGQYRLFGLPPGRYYVRATMRGGASSGYAPSFFPGAYDIAQASLLEAAPGAELRSIDLALRQEASFSITGKVVDGQTGQPVANVYVIARKNGDTFANGAPQLADSFTIHDLQPGKYVLHAQQFSTGAPKTGRQQVDLGNADLSGILLMINSGVEISGTVRDIPEDPPKIHLSLEPDNPAFDTYSATLTAKGTFTFQNVQPDFYHLAWTLPKGVYVKSIKLGDRVLPDDHLDLTGAPAPLAIQLAADGGRVEGIVRNADGEPVPDAVVTMTADPSYDFWSAACDAAGHFEIRDIAPGNYGLLAFDGAPQGAPQDPDFRKPYQKRAVSLQVLPSTQQKIDLVAIAPE